AWFLPLLGKHRAPLGEPALPEARVVVRRFVVEQQQPARLEQVVEAPERCEVLPARTAETEPAADDDSPILPRQLQLVHRLRVEPRRQPFPFRPLAAEREQ